MYKWLAIIIYIRGSLEKWIYFICFMPAVS